MIGPKRLCEVFLIVVVCSGNFLVRAANPPGSFGTDFVFAVPAAARSSNPYTPYMMGCYLPYTTNETAPIRTHKECFATQLSGVGANFSNDKLVSGPQILNIGSRIGSPQGIFAQSKAWGNFSEYPYGDGTLLCPDDALGKNYITNGANQQSCSVTPLYDSTTVTLRFPNRTLASFRLDSVEALVFSVDTTTFGMRINADKPVSVSMGSDCTNMKSGSKCAYLWEQAAPVENFGTDYIFVNPNLEKSIYHPTKICLVNGGNYTVKVNISGITDMSPILLVPGRKVQVDANHWTHSIQADGPIDVQILTSFSDSDTLQIGLIPNHQFANEACSHSTSKQSNLILIALTDDVKNPNSSLVLQNKPFDLGLFRPTADASYSFATIHGLDEATITSSFGFAGYFVAYQNGPLPGENLSSFGSAISRNFLRISN